MFGFNNKVPSAEWLEAANDKTLYTPDVWEIERHPTQLIFVYDEMMKLHHKHKMVAEHSVTIGAALTIDKFTLWKKRLGKESYPIPLDGRWSGVPRLRIKGELYAVQSNQVKELDKYKVNGIYFLRQRVELAFPYTYIVWTNGDGVRAVGDCERKIEAWMYVGVPDFWADQLDGGYMFNPVKTYTPHKEWEDKYYYFSRQEYNC